MLFRRFLLILTIGLAAAWQCLAKEERACASGGIDWHAAKQFFDKTEELKVFEGPSGHLTDNRAEILTRYYHQCVGSRLSRQSIVFSSQDEFKQAFNTLDAYYYMSGEKAMLDDIGIVFVYGQTKGFVTTTEVKIYHIGLVSGRRFAQAEIISKQYPNVSVEALPKLVSAQVEGRLLYALNADGSNITAKSFTLPAGGSVVIVSSPMCGYCRRLFKYLHSHRDLSAALLPNATWITPKEGRLHIAEMVKSRMANPGIDMQYIHDPRQWPEIKYWATPVFYFYDDGVLVGQLAGWKDDEQGKKLAQKLKSINLL